MKQWVLTYYNPTINIISEIYIDNNESREYILSRLVSLFEEYKWKGITYVTDRFITENKESYVSMDSYNFISIVLTQNEDF